MTNKQIEIEHDGRYWRVITFDDKSYVLHKYPEDIKEGESPIKIKGGTLNSRSLEKFCSDFLYKAIMGVFNEDHEQIWSDYRTLKIRIESKIMTAEEVKKRQNINMSLEEYRNKIEAGDSRIAQYEAALNSSRSYLKGDAIETWVKEPEPELKQYKTKEDKWVIPKKASYEIIEPIENFDGEIYREHYQDRLEKTVKKFLTVLGIDEFQRLFPDIKLGKNDKAKMLPIWGLLTFIEKFPNFTFRQQDYKNLSDEDKEQFQKMVEDGQLKAKYREFYEQ